MARGTQWLINAAMATCATLKELREKFPTSYAEPGKADVKARDINGFRVADIEGPAYPEEFECDSEYMLAGPVYSMQNAGIHEFTSVDGVCYADNAQSVAARRPGSVLYKYTFDVLTRKWSRARYTVCI